MGNRQNWSHPQVPGFGEKPANRSRVQDMDETSYRARMEN